MTTPEDRLAWLAQVEEPAIDYERAIIDPHHHLWRHHPPAPYELADWWGDTRSGHRITASVFIECLAEYRSEGPEHLRPVGETEWVAGLAAQSREGPGPPIAAIVGAVDLRHPRVGEALQAHLAAGAGLFRGVRHGAAYDPTPGMRPSHHNPPPELLADAAFRAGFAQLAPLDLSFEAWVYHHQLPELIDLARAFPDTTIILNHLGGVLGVGPYAGRREAVFAAWARDLGTLAQCPNVSVKLGGIAMPINGFGWHERPRPPTSDDLAAAQAPYHHAAIAAFDPERAMFESNFPVEKQSVSYGVLWNAFKKIAHGYNPAEQDALFRTTAARVYRLA